MGRTIGHVTLLVRDYDEAIRFYTECLRFAVVADTHLGGGKRWVLVAPPNSTGARLLLARAATPHQEGRMSRVSISLDGTTLAARLRLNS